MIPGDVTFASGSGPTGPGSWPTPSADALDAANGG
jgi:hypothetical protein